MVSIKNFFGAALVATVALAQAPITNFTSSDINALTSSTTNPTNSIRLAWCISQKTLCGTLCGGTAETNMCDQNSLSFNCTCASNHSSPALQYYRNSMYSNECNAILGNCLAAHANDRASQQNCQNTYICGKATDDQASAAGSSAAAASATSASGSASAAAATGSQNAASGSGVSSTLAHNGAMVSYGEYAPPMFVMMMVGAIASFL